jgi:uncharacterized membrane protein YdfJ with MMPL/SSD domain
MTTRHLAARAGRWSAQHRKAAVLGWIGFVVVSVLLGGGIGTRQIANDDLGVGESGRAQRILHRESPQLGVGLAVAILIDATVVRAVLLPATMKLLGEWNWYLPRWMGWIPQRAVAATE